MHIISQTRVILVSSIENMLIGRIGTADMLSLSLVNSRIFFVSEMKFPYIKDISHTEKMRVKSYPIINYIFMETRIITASATAQ